MATEDKDNCKISFKYTLIQKLKSAADDAVISKGDMKEFSNLIEMFYLVLCFLFCFKYSTEGLQKLRN